LRMSTRLKQATMPVVCDWNAQGHSPRITTITPPVLPLDETQQPAERHHLARLIPWMTNFSGAYIKYF
jgi:hypothetical protein